MKISIDLKSFRKKGLKRDKGFPIGTRVYKGFMGRGKTYSAVQYISKLQEKWPNCVIFSNVKIKGLKNYYYCRKDEDIYFGLDYENGPNGVICFIDEAHLFFNKKTGIPLDVLTQISQQRKERRKIIFTSQIWEELDISLRKQVGEIVKCWNIGNIQINKISNGETLRWDKNESQYVADTIGIEIFKRNEDIANNYDTLQKIETNEKYNRVIIPSFTVTQTVSKEKKNF